MDISFDSPLEQKNYARLGSRYVLISKIGQGATAKMYIGYDLNDKNRTLYAFKIVNPSKPQNLIYYQKEAMTLNALDHPNIVKYYESGSETMIKSNGKSKYVFYIKIEYFKNGQLFDYIYYSKQGLGENLAKVAMHYIINALEHMHSRNIVHRDIKTENIMLDDCFNIKLVDFGFSEIRNKNSDGFLSTYCGTTSYASPELLAQKKYNGVSNDIFAIGVIMFVLVTGNLPFRSATQNDPHYIYFFKGDYDKYWQQREITVSEEFKQLFNSICAVNPTQRPSLFEIKKSQWMNNINYDDLSEFKKVLKKRRNSCQKKNKFIDWECESKKSSNNPFMNNKRKRFVIQKMYN